MSNQFRIDKSNFNAEQLAQYEELMRIGKAEVDPEAAQEEEEDNLPPAPPKKPAKKAEVDDMEETKKSFEVPQFVKDAIAKSEEFMTRIEKQEMSEVAKKYAVISPNTEELAEQLYNLKKSAPDTYQTCITMLDNQLALVNKSGLFAEIGKSAGNGGPVGAEAKIEAKANDIMKADPNISRTDAIAKAWSESPDLMAEYDAEYQQR